MSKKTPPTKLPLHKCTTRREFIAQGLMAGYGILAGPSLLGLALRSVSAQAAGNSYIPFFVIDCAGGAALPGNFLVTKDEKNLDLIKSYDRLGWDPRKVALSTAYGVSMAPSNVSRILNGINTGASAAAQAGLRMGTVCHQGVDDSGVNELSAFQLVNRYGPKGDFITNGLGTNLTPTGGRSTGPDLASTENALQVTSAEALQQVAVGGQFLNAMSQKERANLFAALNDMIGSQVTDAGLTGTELGDRLSYAAKRNVERATMPAEFDPRKNAMVSQIFGLNAGTAATNIDAIRASIAYASLSGLAGPATIVVEGCDYHDGTATTGDNKDQEIGLLIGRLVELAYRMKKKFMFQMITDGGISSDSGTRNWRSDAGDKSMSVLGVFDPTAAPSMKRIQVGAYTDGQGADRTHWVAQNNKMSAYVALANYFSATGIADVAGAMPRGTLSPAQVAEALIFA